MNMVKCSKCGKELEEGSLFCNACGAKQQNQKKHFNFWITFAIIAVVVIAILAVVFIFFHNGNSILTESQGLIENDLGNSITLNDVYYSEERNICIAKFISKGEADIAMIYFDDNSIYYENVFNELTDPYEIILYGYDPVIVYNALNGQNDYTKIQ